MTPPGIRRQWRWFRAPGANRSVAKDEFDALPRHGRGELLAIMKRWERGETVSKEVKSLGDGLLELRGRVGNDQFRLVFFQDSPVHDIAVLAAYKNQNRLPRHVRDTALQRKNQWQGT